MVVSSILHIWPLLANIVANILVLVREEVGSSLPFCFQPVRTVSVGCSPWNLLDTVLRSQILDQTIWGKVEGYSA